MCVNADAFHFKEVFPVFPYSILTPFSNSQKLALSQSVSSFVQASKMQLCWRRDRLPTPVFLGFPVAQLVKNPPAMWETWVLIPGLGRSSGEGKGYSSILENSMDCIVHRVAKSQTQLSKTQQVPLEFLNNVTVKNHT